MRSWEHGHILDRLAPCRHSHSFSANSSLQNLAQSVASNRARFLEAAIRIHSKLVIAPTVPSIVRVKAEPSTPAAATATAPAVDDGGVHGQVEMPFVPAAQRASALAPIDDTIVVVGQPKKKRKRAADKAGGEEATTAQDGSAQTSVKAEADAMEVEAFDYASAPNILDDGSDHEADAHSAKKRQKKGKGMCFPRTLLYNLGAVLLTGLT